jgi:hypothetical protein
LLARRENAGVFRTNGYDFFEPYLWVTWEGVYRSRPAAQGVAPRVTRTIPGAYVALVRKSA